METQKLPTSQVRLEQIDWREMTKRSFEGAEWVINFALHPDQRREPYNVENDVDIKVVNLCPDYCKFMMLSTRKVYGPSAGVPSREDDPSEPIDQYGKNKLETELRLQQLLAERLVTLRVGNIVGNEIGLARNSFMKMLQTELVGRGRVILDVSPDTKRDFLPVDDFARLLIHLFESEPAGKINMGSGIPISLGDIASWVITGFGTGRIEVIDDTVRDEFVLDVSKLKSFGCPVPDYDQIRRWCVQLGKRLAVENI